jgi:integrase/recombinase XerD
VRTHADAELPALLASYVEHLRARRFSESSVRKALSELPRLFESLRVHAITEVTEAQLVRYVAARSRQTTRSGEPLSASTVASTVSTIRGFFAFLLRRGVVLRDPAADIHLPRVRRLPRHVLSEAQARRLVRHPAGSLVASRDRAVLELLYGSALRVGELVRCDLGDVDLAGGVLLVRNGKGRRDRFVPVPLRARRALGSYLAEVRPELAVSSEPALFLTRFGARLGAAGVRARLRIHGGRLRVTPHALRHACATHLLNRGASVRHVQQLLGHRLLSTTALYTHVALGDLRRVLSLTHPRYGAR